MWLRLNGGNSYGNQAGTGTYPNPEAVAATGDARIAPFRHVPRFDALNSFGRNVHCLGNATYDDGNMVGNNQLHPAACGYNINDATTGAVGSIITASTSSDGVPSDATLTAATGDNILSGTTTLTGVPNGVTVGGSGAGESVAFGMQAVKDDVPWGASVSATTNFLASTGTWSYQTNVPTSTTADTTH